MSAGCVTMQVRFVEREITAIQAALAQESGYKQERQRLLEALPAIESEVVRLTRGGAGPETGRSAGSAPARAARAGAAPAERGAGRGGAPGRADTSASDDHGGI